MQNIMYRIGKASEEEHLELDFIDGLLRSVEERIEFGIILIKLPGLVGVKPKLYILLF